MLFFTDSAAAVTVVLLQLKDLLARTPYNCHHADGLQRRVDSLAAAAHLQAHGAAVSEEAGQMSEQDLQGVYGILQSHSEAVTCLQRVLGRINRDIAVLAGTGKRQP